MNFAQGLFVLAAVLLMRKSGTLTWDTVEQWLREHSNRDDYGRGYAGNSLPSNVPSQSFTELRKEVSDGGVRVIANIYLDPRQGAIASKTWDAKKLDAQLEKRFGQQLRIRIDI